MLPKVSVTWPHQVQIGRNCSLQERIYFNYNRYWTPGPSIVLGNRVFVGRDTEFNIIERLVVGDDCLIASGCIFIDHDHGMDISQPMSKQEQPSAPILVGDGAWLGASVIVLKGVQIGEGAVVGAGSVVTRSIPNLEIWGGNPARKIGSRV